MAGSVEVYHVSFQFFTGTMPLQIWTRIRQQPSPQDGYQSSLQSPMHGLQRICHTFPDELGRDLLRTDSCKSTNVPPFHRVSPDPRQRPHHHPASCMGLSRAELNKAIVQRLLTWLSLTGSGPTERCTVHETAVGQFATKDFCRRQVSLQRRNSLECGGATNDPLQGWPRRVTWTGPCICRVCEKTMNNVTMYGFAKLPFSAHRCHVCHTSAVQSAVRVCPLASS